MREFGKSWEYFFNSRNKRPRYKKFYMRLSGLRSIRINLYVIVILAIIPALAIILYSGLEQRQRSIENAKNKLLLLTQTMAGAQQEFTRSVRQMLTTLSLMPEIQRLDRQICKEIFISVLEKNPNYLNFALTDLNGEVLASGKPLTVSSFGDRKHVREVLERNEFSIGEYIISRIGSATPAFAFAFPVRDKNNGFLAVLTTAVRLANFSDFHDISNLPDKSFVAVTDHKGIRLFYYPPMEDTNPVGKQINKQSWEKASKAKGSGIFIGPGSDKVRRIFAFEQVRFKPNDSPYLYVWAGIPESFVLGPANTALIRNLLFLITAAILSLFIAWFVGKKTLLFPIQSLVNLTRRFAEGDLKARSEHTIMPNELGTLTRAFHNMADSLEKNQRTLQNSEEKYRRLIQNAPVGIYQVSEEGCFLTVNQKMAEIFEYDSQDDFLGEIDNISNLYVRPEERASILREIHDKGFVGGKEVELKTKYGKPIWLELYTTVFVDDKNTIYEGLMHDITNRKKLEAQLKQAHKMESIGTMAGGIAHDFNNILYMITGNAELALESISEWNPVRSNLEEIKAAGLRGAGIVKQLLNFSRKIDQKLKPIAAITVIKDALEFLRSTIPTTIEIRKHLPDSDLTILADPIQINQALMNLCTNASQAMEGTGGILEIAVESVSLSKEEAPNYPTLSANEYLKITVSDTGPGIDPEIITRIFDPYFTTKGVGQGSGMGLAVVHGIVKTHAGAITVDSQPGKGTTFSLLFPLVDQEPVLKIEKADPIPVGNESIIVVDDEAAIAHVIGKILEQLGYKTVTKTSPVETLELFQTKPHAFDLVITDMTMPQMTGFGLSQELRAVRSDIPVIVCTGYSSLIDKEKSKELAINAYVMKPIDRKNIAKIVRKVLDEAKSLNHG